jgi:hypothetical protein
MLDGTGAREVGRYREDGARPTDGVVAVTDGVVAGTPGMDADPVGRFRAGDARPIEEEGEASGELNARLLAVNIAKLPDLFPIALKPIRHPVPCNLISNVSFGLVMGS